MRSKIDGFVLSEDLKKLDVQWSDILNDIVLEATENKILNFDIDQEYLEKWMSMGNTLVVEDLIEIFEPRKNSAIIVLSTPLQVNMEVNVSEMEQEDILKEFGKSRRTYIFIEDISKIIEVCEGVENKIYSELGFIA